MSFDLARKFQARAYAPYSGFHVGAVIVTRDGQTFGGANVENASYGLAICAERSAAVNAVSAGYREFKEVYVAGPKSVSVTPCGACRQFLSEFNSTMLVHCTSPGGDVTTTLDKLLPGAFAANDLQ
ncbi:MAG: cytidine deaminase [Candidatus Baltobacteraceae bacterium]